MILKIIFISTTLLTTLSHAQFLDNQPEVETIVISPETAEKLSRFKPKQRSQY